LATQWIVTPRPNHSPKVRLVCVPYAGAGLSVFRGWDGRLPIAEVGIVQLPGRGSRLREPLLESVAAAADGVADAIVRQPAYPTVLFGHGLGALIAFESARRLRERGWPLLALFVSGRRAPAAHDGQPAISHLPTSLFAAEVRRRYGANADSVLGDSESMPLLLPGVRADFAMAETYCYEPAAPLQCPIVACAGGNDPSTSRADLDRWRSETRARLTTRTFAGGHLYLEQERAALTAVIANQWSVMLSALARLTGVR
jgi:surfactin synthase thioesterase subunit